MARKAKTKNSAAAAAQSVVDAGPGKMKITRETTKSPTFFSIYANDVQVQTGPWDMRLILGEANAQATADGQTVTVNQIGILFISPELAKKLTTLMLEQLKAYEEHFGAIPGPKD